MSIAMSHINSFNSIAKIAEDKHNKTKHSIQEYLLHLKGMILVETCG